MSEGEISLKKLILEFNAAFASTNSFERGDTSFTFVLGVSISAGVSREAVSRLAGVL